MTRRHTNLFFITSKACHSRETVPTTQRRRTRFPPHTSTKQANKPRRFLQCFIFHADFDNQSESRALPPFASPLASPPPTMRYEQLLKKYKEKHEARTRTPTINDKFPNITGASTQNTNSFNLYEYFGDSWGIIFMHPGDYTPVCTTELGAAAKLEPEFAKRGVKLCGFSVNDATSHVGWIKDIKVATGQTVAFPLICDPYRDYAVSLGILDFTNRDSVGLPMTVRSVYIIKPDKTIAAMITYPASLGRNFDEILRAVDGLQRGKAGVACPADWRPGNRCIVNFPLSDAQAEEKFGKGGFDIVDLPSERGKTDLKKHYLRYTKDPYADTADEDEGGARGSGLFFCC